MNRDPSSPKIHSKYYFEGPMVVFLVDNTLFRVPSYLFTDESKFFATMFARSPSSNSTTDDESKEQPVVLKDVTENEFVSLLDFFYTRSLPENPTIQQGRLHQRWLDLLSISTRFVVNSARDYAIKSISKVFDDHVVDPIQVIILAKQYELDKWLLVPCTRLCQRETPLLIQEAEEIGFVLAMKIMHAREKAKSTEHIGCGYCSSQTFLKGPNINYYPAKRRTLAEGEISEAVQQSVGL